MTYNTFNVEVWVDGVKEFDEVGYFPGGTFSFYTYSQKAGIFSLVSPEAGFSVCPEEDADSDGVSDNTENGLGLDPTNEDTDADGLDDFEEVYTYETDGTDPDTDGDGLSDGDEIAYGVDPLNPDGDDDGVSDGDEVTNGTDPLDSDSDNDGISDGQEVSDGTDPLVSDQLEGDKASCSTVSDPSGLWPVALVLLPLFRRRENNR